MYDESRFELPIYDTAIRRTLNWVDSLWDHPEKLVKSLIACDEKTGDERLAEKTDNDIPVNIFAVAAVNGRHII